MALYTLKTGDLVDTACVHGVCAPGDCTLTLTLKGEKGYVLQSIPMGSLDAAIEARDVIAELVATRGVGWLRWSAGTPDEGDEEVS